MSKRYLAAIALVVALPVGAFLCCFVLDTSMSRSIAANYVQSLVSAARAEPTNTRFVDELLQKANSDWNFEATCAASALGDLGQAASPRIKQISSLMRSENPYVQREAARSLSKLGPLSAPLLGELKDKVKNDVPSNDATWFAALAIGNIGEPAVDCLPLLRSKLGTGAAQYDDALREAILKLEDAKGNNAASTDRVGNSR